jgi:hypothetical protein
LGFAGSTADLDLFPLGTPEISPVLRSAVDCYELEMASFDALFVPGEEDSPSIRDCRLRGSVCSSGRADDVAGWMALVDQSIWDLGRVLGRVKYGWKALGLGLKPISGPFCFKLPKAFKTRIPKRVLKNGLDPSSSCSTRRRKLHRLTTTQASATVDPVASLDGSALFSTQVPHSELPKPFFEVGLGSSSVSEADPALGCCRVSPETSVLAEKNGFFRYEGSAPPAEVGVSVRPCVTSAADSPRKTTKPLHFYNRKHKVKRASKMDMGKLAGEVICVAPGAVPLVGNQCSVTGGSSGLFSAFEPVGLTGAKVEDPLLTSSVEAGVGLGSQSDKSSDPSSPAEGYAWQGLSQAYAPVAGFLVGLPCL